MKHGNFCYPMGKTFLPLFSHFSKMLFSLFLVFWILGDLGDIFLFLGTFFVRFLDFDEDKFRSLSVVSLVLNKLGGCRWCYCL